MDVCGNDAVGKEAGFLPLRGLMKIGFLNFNATERKSSLAVPATLRMCEHSELYCKHYITRWKKFMMTNNYMAEIFKLF